MQELENRKNIQWFDVNDKLPPPDEEKCGSASVVVIVSEDKNAIALGYYAYNANRWFYYGVGRTTINFEKIKHWGIIDCNDFPRLGCAYYTPERWFGKYQVKKLYWCDDHIDKGILSAGLAFATYEEALAHIPKKFTQKPKRMTVGELIKALQKYDKNLVVAGYSYTDECDFAISKVRKVKVHEDRIGNFYCQAGTSFENDDIGKEVIVLANTEQ